MRLEDLRVGHHLKTDSPIVAPAATSGVFRLESCQRSLWIASVDHYVEIPGVTVYRGEQAYLFLLRVATGLESQILGETDIFGQLKEAWKNFVLQTDFGVAAGLAAWMQRIFEDTKEIRSRHLQNLGGASYGSLVRMLIKSERGPTLIVGAGQIAHSVAPYLVDHEVLVLNRGTERRDELVSQLRSIGQRARAVDPTPEAEARAWREAGSVIVCIPMDAQADDARIAMRGDTTGKVVHLGGHRAENLAWSPVSGFHALDDVFALQKSQGDVRLTQVRQAMKACQERAKLRSLGQSVSIPHGWEDLALFA